MRMFSETVGKLKPQTHSFLNNVKVVQSYERVVKRLKVKKTKTLKTLVLKTRLMWKCGSDGICFNNIFCIFVEIVYHPKLGAVRPFCVVNGCAGSGPTKTDMMHSMYDIRRPILCSFRS